MDFKGFGKNISCVVDKLSLLVIVVMTARRKLTREQELWRAIHALRVAHHPVHQGAVWSGRGQGKSPFTLLAADLEALFVANTWWSNLLRPSYPVSTWISRKGPMP